MRVVIAELLRFKIRIYIYIYSRYGPRSVSFAIPFFNGNIE